MAVGFPTGKQDIDSRAGFLALTLRDALRDVKTLKGWLDGKTEQDLMDLGYTSGEVATLKSAYTDLAKLADIAAGQATQAEASDFFWFAKHLTGLS